MKPCSFRLVVITGINGSSFILQKKLLGFLWWYNPFNIDGMTTGVFDTEEEAVNVWKQHTSKFIKQVVKMDDAYEQVQAVTEKYEFKLIR